MKKVFLSISFLTVAFLKSQAYSVVTVQDSISTNTTWTCDKQYLLKGYVYVTAGATLTIEPGTIIKGDKPSKGALIVERGGKLMAQGTATKPIVFTSNQPAGGRTYGDWGGVIICGQAPTNWTAGSAQVEGGPRSFYGGTNASDNSGTLQYVRIEFGGIAFSPNNEVNGLTLCGVGAGTTIDHIQVSYCGDDSYEWFGGNVNVKNIVSYKGWDDDFDSDAGFTGKGQFMVALRDEFSADVSGSKAIESDSYLSGTVTGLTDTNGLTKGIFSNMTIIGPVTNPASTSYDANYVAGVHIRRGSSLSVVNSVIAGWPCGLLLDESSSSYGSTIANAVSGTMNFRHNIIAGTSNNSTPNPKNIVYVVNGARSLTPTTVSDTTAFITATGSNPVAWLVNSTNKNKMYGTVSAIQLGNPFSATAPNLVPNSGSDIVYGSARFPSWSAADIFDPNAPLSSDTTSPATYNMPAMPPNFTTTKANDAWFTRTNYVGAFGRTTAGNDNWMAGWCSFDPLNEPYDTVCATITSVNEVIENNTNITVFPNPTKDIATVSFDILHGGATKVAIIDAAGTLVKTVFDGQTISGKKSIDFSTSNLANGIYVLSVYVDGRHSIVRFAVSK